VAFLLSAISVNAQTVVENELFYHIGEKDGLADNIVTCFYQDYRGVMWMGTQYGLNSFDGSEIRTWKSGSKASANQLVSNEVKCLAADSSRNLWIGTAWGLSSINLATQRIRTWHYNGNNDVRSIACEGANVWMATGEGILLLDSRTQKFTHFTNAVTSPSTLSYYFNNNCNYIFIDSKKRIWVATVNGVWLFNRVKRTFEQYDGPKNDAEYDSMVSAVFEDHAHRLWLGCWGKGIKQIDPDSRSVTNFVNDPGMPGHVTNITEQNNSGRYSLWLNGYLTEFKADERHFYRHSLRPVAEAAPLDPVCVYVSRENLLWVSTVKGVYIIDPARQLFKHHFIIGQDVLTGQNAAILPEKDRFWLTGDKNFLLKAFDYNFGLIKDYTPAIKELGGPYGNNGLAIMSISRRNDREYWLSTSSGVLKLDVATGRLSVVFNSLTDSSKRPATFINNVLFLNGKTWCFPWRRGLWEMNDRTGSFVPVFTNMPEGKSVKNLNLQEAVTDKNGNTWISDMDYGVIKYSTATGKAQRFITPDIANYGRTVNIISIRDRLWILSNMKIVAIDPYSEKTTAFPLPDGMNKYVYCYTTDGSGNLWLATRTGLVVFNTINHSFNQYTEEDGLLNNDLNGTIGMLPNGNMIYAGENYVTSFKPAELLRVPAQKKLLLTAVATADTNLVAGTYRKIVVPAGNEKLTFKWAFINYSNPLQNRYYNKLDGIDKDWNYSGNKGSVEYNGLSPGKYKFRYKAVSADGLSMVEKSVIFTIRPSFWQTWWFIALMIVMLMAGIALIVEVVRRRERRKAAMQLQLSNLEMKALRAQMNPHFIFNALNSIQECIVTKNTTTAHNYLSNFSKLVRMILENSEKQFITLEDEIETLSLYLSLEKLRFDDSFEYKMTVDAGIDTSFVHIPAMMVQPFVENTLWHGLIHKKGKKELSIKFGQQGSNLICIVQDNGIGRDNAALLKTSNQLKKHSMGMKITEERLQLLETGASITIDDLKNDEGQSVGTRVTIVIPLDL